MRLGRDLGLGLSEISAHKLRSLLTMLGVIFGTASFVALFALLTGAMETSRIWMREIGGLEKVEVVDRKVDKKEKPGLGFNRSRGRTLKDALAVHDGALLVSRVSPEVDEETQVRRAGKESWVRVQGVTKSILAVNRYEVEHGRFFGPVDQERAAKVCVLGTKVAEDLFGDANPLGQRVTIVGSPYVVVGVLKRYVLMHGDRNSMEWKNRVCYIPLMSMLRRIKGNEQLTWLNLEMKDTSRITETLDQVRNILLKRHGVNDFRFSTREEWASQLERSDSMWKVMLGAIGAICLLTGGVGIMNIMLAAVNERTREIGIRRALGARRKDILLQFLLETIMLSVSGGLVGILAGVGLAELFSMLPEQQAIVTPMPLLLAFSFSVAVGLFFGLYPARRASRLDPLEALRYE